MKNIFKTIGYILSLPFVLLAVLFGLLSAKRKAKKYLKDPTSIFPQDRAKVVYKLFRKFLYIKRVEIEVNDIEHLPAKQMLFICNHKGILDPIVLFVALYEAEKIGTISFIAKNELSKKWVTRCVIQLMDGIFLQRDDGRSIYNCYLKETENLKKGYSVAVYPEGTRVRGDDFGEFKAATLKVAYENFVAIEPCAVYGTDKKRKFTKKLLVRIAFLKPLQPTNFINIKQEQLMATLQSSIFAKYNQLKEKPIEAGK